MSGGPPGDERAAWTRGLKGLRGKGGLWLGVAALVCAAALWSLNGPLIKLLNERGSGLPGVTIACYRSLLGGLLFLPFAAKRWSTLRHVRPAWPIASVATFTLMTAAFVIATTMTAAANAIVLQYTAPLFVFALSPLLLGERPRLGDGLALLVSLAGVAVIVVFQPPGQLAGVLVALLSGLGYGALIVTLRGLREVDPTVVVAMNFLGSGLLLLPAAALWGTLHLTQGQLLLLVLMSAVQFALPYALFSWALRRVEAHSASLIALLETVLNPLWTWLAVGERVPAGTLAGGPLVLLGVIGWMLLAWRRSRRGA